MAKTKVRSKSSTSTEVAKGFANLDLYRSRSPAANSKYLAALYSEIRVVEKKIRLSSSGFDRYADRVSSGLLCLDMNMDGGLVPGGWYTFSGGEQSCKSTLTMTVMASCIKSACYGITAVFDYEGSSDAQYIKNILRNSRVDIDEIEIFGLADEETGEQIIEPRILYYAPDSGTKFFDYMSSIRRRLPDKVVEKDGSAYLLYENNRENQKLCAGDYDKKHFSKHNEFKVPAPDAGMQYLVILDSLPAMLPDAQDDDEVGNAMAVQARMFSDGIKRFRGGMRRKMITLLAVNQLRQKPATMYGDPAYEPCGDAVKFFCYAGDTILSTSAGLMYGENITALPNVDVNSRQGNAKILEAFEVGEASPKRAMTTVKTCNSRITVSRDHAFLTLRSTVEANTITMDAVWDKASNLSVGRDMLFSAVNCPSLPKDLVELTMRSPSKESMQDVEALMHNKIAYIGSELSDDLVKLRPGALISLYARVVRASRSLTHIAYRFRTKNPQLSAELLRNLGVSVIGMSGNYIDYIPLASTDLAMSASRSCALMWADFLERFDSTLSGRLVGAILEGRLAFRNDGDNRTTQHLASTFNSFVDQLYYAKIIPESMHDWYSYIIGHMEDLQTEVGVTSLTPNLVFPVTVVDVNHVRRNIKLFDCQVDAEDSSIITSGVISHNSDVRWRLASRAIPKGWKGEAGIVEESSVEYPGSVDQYRFISAKSIKNKMGGIPNQTTWMRLWQSDGKGDARGFDPVYDTYNYMLTLGLIEGQRNKIKFVAPTPFADTKSVTWDEFRILINGDKKQIKEICDKMGAKKAGRIREWCFDFVASDKGRQLVRDSIVKKVKKADEDEE